MRQALVSYVFPLFLSFFFITTSGKSQEKLELEQQFHELFITAGYSTALGAAVGAAVIGLTKSPSQNLRYIGVGASLGFLSGCLLGSYLIFPTILLTKNATNDNQALTAREPISDWSVAPIFKADSFDMTGAALSLNFRL